MRVQALFLAVAVLLVAGVASATGTYGTVSMTYQNDNFPTGGGATPPTSYIYKVGAASNGVNVYVGRSNFLITGVTDNLPQYNPLDGLVGTNLTAYCIDVYQFIGYGQSTTWDVNDLSAGPTMDLAKAKLLAELTNMYIDDVTTVTKAAAFQAAVWEIVNEALPASPVDGDHLNTLGYDVTSGSFHLYSWNDGGAFAAQANAWLQAMIWPGDDPSQDYSLVSASTQDFGLLFKSPGEPPVPEPVTMFSAFLAISGLGMYIRRRMKAPVVA